MWAGRRIFSFVDSQLSIIASYSSNPLWPQSTVNHRLKFIGSTGSTFYRGIHIFIWRKDEKIIYAIRGFPCLNEKIVYSCILALLIPKMWRISYWVEDRKI